MFGWVLSEFPVGSGLGKFLRQNGCIRAEEGGVPMPGVSWVHLDDPIDADLESVSGSNHAAPLDRAIAPFD